MDSLEIKKTNGFLRGSGKRMVRVSRALATHGAAITLYSALRALCVAARNRSLLYLQTKPFWLAFLVSILRWMVISACWAPC